MVEVEGCGVGGDVSGMLLALIMTGALRRTAPLLLERTWWREYGERFRGAEVMAESVMLKSSLRRLLVMALGSLS